ncbi:MAG: PAS domain S-box protein, partial [Cyanobacteria bacterium]|nr:PAS domain S-box protein [Cyanobacteriota bacterium]MDW8201278.1 PAS domain S-box protein [Cyanobacteriota bacterium SKYGB_h_bin112]
MLPDLSDCVSSAAASGQTESSSDVSDDAHQHKLPITPQPQAVTQSLDDRLLRAFFTEALDAMVITDDGRYVEANPAACELFGLPREELLGRCIADFSVVSIDMQAAWQAFRARGHERGTFSLVRADGVTREVEYAATADFAPHRHLSILRDVTERNQLARELHTLNQTLEQQVAERTVELQRANAELCAVNQRLQIAHDRYDWVIRSIGEGIWDWDLRSNRAVVSDRYWQILGYDPQQRGNETLETILSRTHPDDIPRIQQALEQHLRHRQPYIVELRVQHQAGHYVWIRSRGQAIWDEQGNPVRMVGTIEDISDRKAAELALSQQEQKFRTLTENSPDCIMRCDRQFRFLYVNPITATLTGIPRHLLLGKTSEELGFPSDLVTLWHGAMTQVFTTGQDVSLEYTMLLPVGKRTMSSRIVPERDIDGTVVSVLIVVRDITDLKQAQQMLLLQAEQERILSTIVHHIRESLDLDQILDAAVHDVHQLLQADRVLVYRFNPDGSGDMIAEAVSEPWISALGSNLQDPCFTDELVTAYG